jgi:PqqD family protein of HPr-rel-A system
MRSPPSWRLAPGQRLVHRCHDGECVLFNDLSGATHLVDDITLGLLQALADAPQTASALAGDADPDTLAALDELLAGLAALYLIEAVEC